MRKGGLEVLPKIIDKLDKYLEDNGTCLLLMNSFFKNKKDTLEEYFVNILKKKKNMMLIYFQMVFFMNLKGKKIIKKMVLSMRFLTTLKLRKEDLEF